MNDAPPIFTMLPAVRPISWRAVRPGLVTYGIDAAQRLGCRPSGTCGPSSGSRAAPLTGPPVVGLVLDNRPARRCRAVPVRSRTATGRPPMSNRCLPAFGFTCHDNWQCLSEGLAETAGEAATAAKGFALVLSDLDDFARHHRDEAETLLKCCRPPFVAISVDRPATNLPSPHARSKPFGTSDQDVVNSLGAVIR